MISKIIEIIKRKRGYYERKAAWPSNLEVVSIERAGGGKIDELKSEIDRLRRNKKKVSHLVAELAELENGK